MPLSEPFVALTYQQLGEPGDPGPDGREIMVAGHDIPFFWRQRDWATLSQGDFEGFFMFHLNQSHAMARRYEIVGNSYFPAEDNG